MFEPVRNYEDVLENVKVFHKNLGSSEELTKRLGYFRHWYYFEEYDTFAPGRFIGYQGISVEMYAKDYHEYIRMDGNDTVRHLKYWFCLVNNPEKELYIAKLEAMLNLYDKKPNGTIYLYKIRIEEYEQLTF